MSDLKQEASGGVASTHPRRRALPLFLGPQTETQSNTVRLALRPIACWRLDDVRFDFDSSFVMPKAAEEYRRLAELAETHPTGRPSLFAHTDPINDDEYNKKLSGRRALSVYGLLVRSAETWEELHATPLGGDQWGLRQHQVMLATAGEDVGTADGIDGPRTQSAFRSFQAAHGLPPTGFADAKTRHALYLSYMDAICRDGSDKPFRYEKAAFLAGGKDAGGKGDVQGCSEFNPILLLSKGELSKFAGASDKSQRNAENAPNRRVVVLLFDVPAPIEPSSWPCPRVHENSTQCRKRFWSDGETRRSSAPARRQYAETFDTFACRFYDWLARDSPCEAGKGKVGSGIATFRILRGTAPVANLTLVIGGPDGATLERVTDADGEVRVAGVFGEEFVLLEVREGEKPVALSTFDVAATASQEG